MRIIILERMFFLREMALAQGAPLLPSSGWSSENKFEITPPPS